MNRETVKGNWNQLKGKLKEAWGDLTDDELKQAEGNRDQFVGLVQKKYGKAKDAISKQLSQYERDSGYA